MAIILCGTALVLSVNFLTAFAKSVERRYPLLESSLPPVHIAVQEVDRTNDPAYTADPSRVDLQIPVSVSGIARGTMLYVRGIKIYSDPYQESILDKQWQYGGEAIWPEDQTKALSYSIDRKVYEKLKDQKLRLRIELAFSQYQDAEPRTFVIPYGTFADNNLGRCRLFQAYSELKCLQAISTPGYIARFDPQASDCSVPEREENLPIAPVAYAWNLPTDEDFLDPELSPVADYSIWFREASIAPPSGQKQPTGFRSVRLCPGTEIRLSRPILTHEFRIQLDFPDARLEDLAQASARSF